MELARMRGTFFIAWGLRCTARDSFSQAKACGGRQPGACGARRGALFHKLKLAVAYSLGLAVGDCLVFFTAWGLRCTAGGSFSQAKACGGLQPGACGG